MPLIALVVLLVAGIYLEKVDRREAAIWTFVAVAVGWILFRRQGDFGAMIGLGVVDLLLALRIFGGAQAHR